MNIVAAHLLLLNLAQAGAQTQPQQTDHTTLLIWAVVFLGAALILAVVEMFVPSGGIIGFCALLSAITGVVLLFGVSTTLGLLGAILTLAAIPVLFAFGLKIFPHTPVGRAIMLQPSDEEMEQQQAWTDGTVPVENRADDAPHPLIGHSGIAQTDLRPIGACRIDGQRMDCMAVGGMIRQGDRVEVVAADGMQIKVKKVS